MKIVLDVFHADTILAFFLSQFSGAECSNTSVKLVVRCSSVDVEAM